MPYEQLPEHRRAPTSFGRSLDRVVRSLGGPGVDVIATVFSRWDEVVGEQLSEHTTPSRLEDGCLVVLVDDPAWAPQVRYLATDLLGRLDALVGQGEITRIEVLVDRSAHRR